MVGYGGPQVDVPLDRVTIEAREGTAQGRLLGSTVSGPDGRFLILGLAAGTAVSIQVPVQDAYRAGSFPPVITCADQVVEFGFGVLVDRYLTGINYQHGSTLPAGATIRWDPAPDITSYCVELSVDFVRIADTAARLGATGTCPGFNPGWPIGPATSFTLPSGASGMTVRFVVRGYHPKVSLPVAYLRGGLPASFEGMQVYTVQ